MLLKVTDAGSDHVAMGSDHVGSDHAGSVRAGSDHVGSDHVGSDHAGSVCAGSDHVGSDHAQAATMQLPCSSTRALTLKYLTLLAKPIILHSIEPVTQ